MKTKQPIEWVVVPMRIQKSNWLKLKQIALDRRTTMAKIIRELIAGIVK
jgi:predicted DNA-binding ribbon-helix-helix protein